MSMPEDIDIESRLRERLSDSLPPEMEVRLRARLAEFRSRLEHLDFLGPRRTTMRVLDQRMEKIAKAGHNWLDYRVTVADPSLEQRLRMVLRVDAATKLPALCRIDGLYGVGQTRVETQLEYPDRGPANVYDLGVPMAARRVDRVAVGDPKRIRETIKSDQRRLDGYRAVFVRTEQRGFHGRDDDAR